MVHFWTDAGHNAARRSAKAEQRNLIDGDRLCDLLKNKEMSATTTIRQIENITVQSQHFAKMYFPVGLAQANVACAPILGRHMTGQTGQHGPRNGCRQPALVRGHPPKSRA